MQFTTLVSLLSVASGALAAAGGTTVHVVTVGNANGTLAYSPNNLVAAVGDMVQFQFAPVNHTVTQSTFDQPCQPLHLNSNLTGIYSGFMPVSASDQNIPTYTIMINSTTPLWLYCSQGKHCQAGMTMVINENVAANASRSLQAFQALAATQTVNLPGNAVANGTTGSTTAGSTGTGSGSSSSPSSTSTKPPASGAMALTTSSLGYAGMLAVAVALFM